MNIRQCIPSDRERVSAFLQKLGGNAADVACAFEHQLSLVADEADSPQGVALFRKIADSTSRELAVAVIEGNTELLHALIDKSLAKLHAHGIHKCKVTLLNREEPQNIWNQTRWSATRSVDKDAAPQAEAKTEKKPKKPRKAKTDAQEPAAAAA